MIMMMIIIIIIIKSAFCNVIDTHTVTTGGRSTY